MKIALTTIAVLAMLIGAVWVAQGTGVLPYGFMANEMTWTYRGVALFVAGVALLILARRR